MARFTDRFGKRKCFYSTDIKEVRTWLNEALYENKNKLNVSDDTITLNEWFEKWLTYERPYKIDFSIGIIQLYP